MFWKQAMGRAEAGEAAGANRKVLWAIRRSLDLILSVFFKLILKL